MSRIKWIAGVLLLFSLIFAYSRELPIMMNYLEVGEFWQMGLSLGLVIGILTLVILFTRSRLRSLPIVERMQLGSTVIFLGLLLLPLLLSRTNRWGISTGQASSRSVIFESEQARFSSRFGNVKGHSQKANQFILFFFEDGQLRRVNGQHPFFPGAQSGDTVRLTIVEGQWGYRWVAR